MYQVLYVWRHVYSTAMCLKYSMYDDMNILWPCVTRLLWQLRTYAAPGMRILGGCRTYEQPSGVITTVALVVVKHAVTRGSVMLITTRVIISVPMLIPYREGGVPIGDHRQRPIRECAQHLDVHGRVLQISEQVVRGLRSILRSCGRRRGLGAGSHGVCLFSEARRGGGGRGSVLFLGYVRDGGTGEGRRRWIVFKFFALDDDREHVQWCCLGEEKTSQNEKKSKIKLSFISGKSGWPVFLNRTSSCRSREQMT